MAIKLGELILAALPRKSDSVFKWVFRLRVLGLCQSLFLTDTWQCLRLAAWVLENDP